MSGGGSGNQNGVLRRISPAEALEKMTREQYTYLDVRSAIEFSEGRPQGAVNIPITNNDDAFLDYVTEKGYAKDARLIVGCQTGVRSLRAARLLLDAGFSNVFEQRAGWDSARGPFGEMTEPGWSRLDLPSELG